MSSGRFLLGVASGDRPEEFPEFGLDVGKRGEVFREAFGVVKKAWTTEARGLDLAEDPNKKPEGHASGYAIR